MADHDQSFEARGGAVDEADPPGFPRAVGYPEVSSPHGDIHAVPGNDDDAIPRANFRWPEMAGITSLNRHSDQSSVCHAPGPRQRSRGHSLKLSELSGLAKTPDEALAGR